MTTIAAVQGDGWVVIGCDSKTTLENGRYLETVSRKVVNVGGILVAGAGASRGSNLLHYSWKPPKIPAVGSLDNWFTSQLIPSVRTLFLESGYDTKEDGAAAGHDSEFLLSVRGTIYHLFSDYAWERDERGIYILGTGGELALGALEAMETRKMKDIDEVTKAIKKAVSIAVTHDVNSGGKVHVYTQKK